MSDVNQTEHAPSLEQMESAKSALLTFVMYYYQALRQHGHDVTAAKGIVADEILSLYDRYAQKAKITFRPDAIIDPMQLLDEITQDVRSLGANARPLHQKLIDFKNLIKGE